LKRGEKAGSTEKKAAAKTDDMPINRVKGTPAKPRKGRVNMQGRGVTRRRTGGLVPQFMKKRKLCGKPKPGTENGNKGSSKARARDGRPLPQKLTPTNAGKISNKTPGEFSAANKSFPSKASASRKPSCQNRARDESQRKGPRVCSIVANEPPDK